MKDYKKNYIACRYNVGVECPWQNGCGSCGWNPSIAEKRKEKVRTGCRTTALDLCEACRLKALQYNDLKRLGMRNDVICDVCGRKMRGGTYLLVGRDGDAK